MSKIKQEGMSLTFGGGVGTAGVTCELNPVKTNQDIAWSAPEVIRQEQQSFKADVYSYGIVMWEVVTREDPYGSMHPMRGIKYMNGFFWSNECHSCFRGG